MPVELYSGLRKSDLCILKKGTSVPAVILYVYLDVKIKPLYLHLLFH